MNFGTIGKGNLDRITKRMKCEISRVVMRTQSNVGIKTQTGEVRRSNPSGGSGVGSQLRR